MGIFFDAGQITTLEDMTGKQRGSRVAYSEWNDFVQTLIDLDADAETAITDFLSAYQLSSEKSQALGYASLNASGLVPTDELGTNVADNTTFLRGDQTWAEPPATEVDLSGITNNRLVKNNAGVLDNSIISDDGTNITLTGGQLLVPNGSGGSPPYSFANDTDTGIYAVNNRINLISGGNAIFDGSYTEGFLYLIVGGGKLAFYPPVFGPDSANADLGGGGEAAGGFNRFRSANLGGNTVTTSRAPLDIAQTWNDGAITFRAAKVNITDAASAAASLLLDLQVGGTSKFGVRKDGAILNSNGSESLPSISFQDDTNTGFYKSGADVIYLTLGGATKAGMRDNSFFVGNPIWGNAEIGVGGDRTISPAPAGLSYTHSGSYEFVVRGHHTPTGFNNITGGPLVLSPGLGSGSGLSGSIIFRTSDPLAAASVVNTAIERARILPAGHLRLSELSANPGTGDLTSLAHVTMYMKSDKLVFAYNNGGVVTYISIPLDGATTTWTHSTTAP